MKSIKLSNYFELVKPTYIYVQVIPHKSIRNYNSSNIAKAVAHTYRAIDKRIKRKQKKIFFETNFKVSYVIDIENNNANFYFVVPKPFLNSIIEKIKEIWSKATINILDHGIKPFSDTADYYELSYKKEDALSLAIDKKSNEPLNSILSVMDIMKDKDRVTLIYNFMPSSQMGWMERHEEIMDKARKKKCLDKEALTPGYLFKISLSATLSIIDGVLDVINDFLGGKVIEERESLYASVMGILEQQKELSTNTHKKKELTILPTQIGVVSHSTDITRKENNVISICQSFRTLDDDNELKYKKSKSKFKIEEYSLNTKSSIFSTEEISNFIQIPGRSLLLQHGIKFIKTEENSVPEELRIGNKRLGDVTFKGEQIKAFLDEDWDIGNCSLSCIGGMGAGKSTFMANYCKDCIDAGEGIILIDFIKSCELSDTIAAITPKEKLVRINLADEKGIQAFAYNEMKINNNMSIYKKLDIASMQSEQMMSLIDSISIGEPLSSSMRRLFNAACTIVSIQGYNSLKNTIECLEDHEKRKFFIENLSCELKDYMEDEIKTLNEINDYSKDGKLIGTKFTKITFILDRIDLLRSNFKLKYMYKSDPEKNIDLKACMNQGKVVLIQMADGDFPTRMQKNILVTYWITKIWLASQLRGMDQKKPNRVNMLVDEIFQAPTALSILEYILVQARKFSLKPVLSMHYIRQVEKIFDALLTSNGSFMLMKGCTEDDYNHFKNKIEGFEYEDLRDMKRHHSLNLVYYSGGYASFISKLPRPIGS